MSQQEEIARAWMSESKSGQSTTPSAPSSSTNLTPRPPTTTDGNAMALPGRSTMIEPEDGLEHAFTYYYGMLIHQQNMLQDHVRTGTYQRAVMENKIDFKDKVVVDVGTGSGILALFAAQAGARKVYAVEASAMAEKATEIVAANGFEDVVVVIKGKIEEINIPGLS